MRERSSRPTNASARASKLGRAPPGSPAPRLPAPTRNASALGAFASSRLDCELRSLLAVGEARPPQWISSSRLDFIHFGLQFKPTRGELLSRGCARRYGGGVFGEWDEGEDGAEDG